MQKLILRNLQSPGDTVMLTALVRDLHALHPRRFVTDVRTPSPELWENNPYVTRIDESDAEARVIDCEYPLIHSSNTCGQHFVHGFHEHASRQLQVPLAPTRLLGDIHMSAAEMAERPPCLDAIDGEPFWLLVAGGKFDFTAKWWPTTYYQAVVDGLADRVTFVQVGSLDHFHPRIRNAVDLRGRLSLRELIRIVYWSAGVLCPVTLHMHLAAAVPVRIAMRDALRPCVVVAGGREPPSWEMYPGHQFLHTIGALDCCAYGGRWRSRTFALRDGSEQDKSLCRQPVGEWARCMTMITPEHVTGAIQLYASARG
jgi:ADP-heptose:LPS heptosyltransferase